MSNDSINKTDIVVGRFKRAENMIKMLNFLRVISSIVAIFAIICAIASIVCFGASRTVLGICLIVSYVVLNCVWFALAYVFKPRYQNKEKSY